MTKQVTLVSLYGEKEGNLAPLISQCQDLVAKVVGSTFTRYELPQVHATIIGLERRPDSSASNANFSKHRSRDIVMDFDGFLAYVRSCGHFPFEVQIGGFANRDYPFTSRKTLPYERSFSIQDDKVVLMGWPLRGEPVHGPPVTPQGWVQEARIYPPTLDVVRHAAQRFGILHEYHRVLTDADNDLFFRIGLIDDPKSVTPATASVAQSQVRQFLSTQSPLVVGIRLSDVYIAAYEDNRLPLSSTQSWPLTDPTVSGEFVASLFT